MHIIYRTFIVYYATYFCGKFYLNFSHVEFYFIIFFNFRCNKLQKLWAISLSLLSLIYVAKMLDIFMCTHFLIPFFFFFIFVNNIFSAFLTASHTRLPHSHIRNYWHIFWHLLKCYLQLYKFTPQHTCIDMYVWICMKKSLANPWSNSEIATKRVNKSRYDSYLHFTRTFPAKKRETATRVHQPHTQNPKN